MVKSIISVRRSSICWRGRRELITDVRKPEIMVTPDVIARRRAIYWLLRSPSQTCHAKPKTQINRRRTLPASFPLVGCLHISSLAWKISLEKSGRCGIAAIKRRGALPMIDRGDIRQVIDRCSNIWASLPGAGYGQFEHKADSLIAKFKEAGGTVRDWCMSEVTAIISALVICIIVCLSWAVNHYRDNAITYKAQRDKNARENWSWRTRQLLTCRCVSMMLLRSMQNTRGLADAKAENDALRDDVAAGRRQFAHQSSLSVSAWSTPPPPAWIMQPPRLADTIAERDYFTLEERLITMQKQLEGTQKYINEQCR